MSTQDAKVRASADQKGEKGAFDLLSRNELMWWPYRSFSKALLRTHDNLAAFMEVNRKLADEMREIIHKEQDLRHADVGKDAPARRVGEGKR